MGPEREMHSLVEEGSKSFGVRRGWNRRSSLLLRRRRERGGRSSLGVGQRERPEGMLVMLMAERLVVRRVRIDP